MAEKSRGFLFRKRTFLGAALIAGIGLGILLGQIPGCPGLGGLGLTGGKGSGSGSGEGNTAPNGENAPIPDDPNLVAHVDSSEPLPTAVPKVVRVVIDERQYLLRSPEGDTPITLQNLVDLIKKAPGDTDGFRVRIYEKLSARASAEEKLKTALTDGGIPDNAVLWVPTQIKE